MTAQQTGPLWRSGVPAHAGSYTRFVTWSKYSLWLFAAAVLALVVWIGSADNENGRMVFSSVPGSDNLQNVMAKPYFQGFDSRNRPFALLAEKATQLDEQTMTMEKVQADLMLENNGWTSLSAATGQMNSQTRQLDLAGGVDLFYEGGYEFRSDHAHVDIPKGHVSGDSPVTGQGPAGTLQADRFEVLDHGKIIHFEGSVKTILYR